MKSMLDDITMTGAVHPKSISLARAEQSSSSEKVEPIIIVNPITEDMITVSQARAIVNQSGTLDIEVIKSQDVSYERPIELFGVEFVISHEQKEAFIFHRTWSVSGHGMSIPQAIRDLQQTLLDLKDHYAHTSIDQLDGRAVLFRDFVLNSVNL